MKSQLRPALRSIKNETVDNEAEALKFKDGDDGGGEDELDQFLIEIAKNGFMLTTTAGLDEEKEVYRTIDEVFKSIKRKL